MSTNLQLPPHLKPLCAQGAVVAIGNFDGLHLGHQELLRQAADFSRGQGLPLVAMTFSPHPVTYFRGSPPDAFRLATDAERLALLGSAGAAGTWTVPFDPTFANLSPHDFVDDVLRAVLHARGVFVGGDFHFGKDRRGTPDMLVALGAARGIHVHISAQVADSAGPFSSSRVRKALRSGDMAALRRDLGRPWTLQGLTRPGAGRGQDMGIPTMNLVPEDRLLPPRGVYATWATWDGAHFEASVTNLGVRPTFDDTTRPLAETLVLGQAQPPRGRGFPLLVAFVAWLRPERRFPDAPSLLQQIEEDRTQAALHLASPMTADERSVLVALYGVDAP